MEVLWSAFISKVTPVPNANMLLLQRLWHILTSTHWQEWCSLMCRQSTGWQQIVAAAVQELGAGTDPCPEMGECTSMQAGQIQIACGCCMVLESLHTSLDITSAAYRFCLRCNTFILCKNANGNEKKNHRFWGSQKPFLLSQLRDTLFLFLKGKLIIMTFASKRL